MALKDTLNELEQLGALVEGAKGIVAGTLELTSALDIVKAARKASATAVTEEYRGGKPPRCFVTVDFSNDEDANAFWTAINALRPPAPPA